MLGGMAALPGPEWSSEKVEAAGETLARVRHVFTHFALELSIVASADVPEDGWWQPIASLPDAGLPTLYRRGVDAVLSARVKIAA